MVSTAKEGIFKRETTLIFEIQGTGKLPSHYKTLAKVFYKPAIQKLERLQWHNRIVHFIEELSLKEQPPSLDDAISTICGYLLGQEGIEYVHQSDS